MVARKKKSPWKPISEAPRDGTLIIGIYPFHDDTSDYGIIRWTENWHRDGSGAWTDQFCDEQWNEPALWADLP